MISKKFKGPKSFGVIKAQCEAQGLNFSPVTGNALLPGYALVSESDSEGAYAFYSEKTGHFFGRKDDLESFNSDGGPIVKEQPEWFYALQEFFLEPADEPVGELAPLADSTTALNLGEQAFEDGAHPSLTEPRRDDVVVDDVLRDEGEQ